MANPTQPVPANPVVQMISLAVWLLVYFTAPAWGAFSMPESWHAQLQKPSWNPPSWIFGPVWTLFYTMMSIAAVLNFTLWRLNR